MIGKRGLKQAGRSSAAVRVKFSNSYDQENHPSKLDQIIQWMRKVCIPKNAQKSSLLL